MIPKSFRELLNIDVLFLICSFVQYNKLPLHRIYSEESTRGIFTNTSNNDLYLLEGHMGGGKGKTAWLNVKSPRPGEWFAVVSIRPRHTTKKIIQHVRLNN